MTTTYTTADNTRTAEHDEVRNTLTVFQGLNIISSLDVDADITPGEIWLLITGAKEPVVEVTETETTEFAGWFAELLDQILDCRDMDLFEREAYAGYISYGASMTDGLELMTIHRALEWRKGRRIGGHTDLRTSVEQSAEWDNIADEIYRVLQGIWHSEGKYWM